MQIPYSSLRSCTIIVKASVHCVAFAFYIVTLADDGRCMIAEHSTAADFIERALFTYERAFVGAFTFTGGGNRLDFDR